MSEWFHLDGGRAYRVWRVGKARIGYYSTMQQFGRVTRYGLTVWFVR